jgi:hypothetical protein
LAIALAVVGVLPRGGEAEGAGGRVAKKKLIEFGWDEPDARFMREHIAQLQASPFDGCVFHVDYRTVAGDSGNFAWKVWGRRRFEAADLAAAREHLLATRFGRFRDNFLRVNVTPGDLDWFEDHSAVLANLELAARLAKEAGCPGVMFDVEPYEGKLWDFGTQTRERSRSWDELSAQVRRRGAEVMRAFERGYPGLTVFMTIAFSMPLHETGVGGRTLAQSEYGLLAPFLDGMVSAASGQTRFVDGHELSYPYRDPAQFAAKADSMRHGVQRLAAEPDRYLQRLSVSFGIWLDNDWRALGWDTADPEQNYRTPASFGRVVQAALEHADHFVWIYSETPRWWSAEGGTKRLPAVYDSVLRAVRR